MEKAKSKLAIDARPFARGQGGIKRYLQKLLPHIIDSQEYEVILYSDKPIPIADIEFANHINVRFIKQNFLANLLWYIKVPLWLKEDKINIFWSPRHHLPLFVPKGCKKIVTIHDFVWKTSPHTMPALRRLSEKILMPRSVSKADKIICISRTTHELLARFYPQTKHKSRIILHGNELVSSKKSKTEHSSQSYFVTVGTLEPRKNYERLIQAFDLYSKNGGTSKLVIVGRQGWSFKSIYKELNECKCRSKIKVVTNASDEQLSSLYQGARGFISCSIDEGYGLPPQEAMLYGIKIMLSDIAIYRELYPGADIWVKPLSIESIQSGIFSLEKKSLEASKDIKSIKSRDWMDCSQELINYISS